VALRNEVEVGDDGVFGPDINPLDNEYRLDTEYECPVDLAVGKDDGIGEMTAGSNPWVFEALGVRPEARPEECVYPGELVTYTIAYLNAGLGEVTGVVLTETLPAYTTYVGGGWTAAGGETYTRSIGTVAAGAGGVVTFVVEVESAPEDLTVHDVVAIGSGEEDFYPADNEARHDTPVCLSIDLVVTKGAGPLRLGPEKEYWLDYRIVVTNSGVLTATNVVVTDTLPLEAVERGGTGSCSGGECVWLIASLAPSETVDLSLPVELVTPTVSCPLVLTNTVVVTDDGYLGPDINPLDNVYTLTTEFECPVDLVVVKNDNVGPEPAAEVAWVFEEVGLSRLRDRGWSSNRRMGGSACILGSGSPTRLPT